MIANSIGVSMIPVPTASRGDVDDERRVVDRDREPGVEDVDRVFRRESQQRREQEREPERPERHDDRERDDAERQQDEVVDHLDPRRRIARARDEGPVPGVAGRFGPVRARHVDVEQERRTEAFEPAHRPRDVEHRDQDRDADQRDQEAEPEREPRHDDRERRDADRQVEQEVGRLLPGPDFERRP
jgi:hypothetical protein